MNSPGGGLSQFLKSEVNGPSSRKPLSINTEDCDEVHFIAVSNADDDGTMAMQHVVDEMRRFTEEDEDLDYQEE